jgi:hypothetical protein
MPSILKGDLHLLGREILYRDTAPIKYPADKDMFEAYNVPGKFDPKDAGKSFIPLSVPTINQFYAFFGNDKDYKGFLKKYNFKEPRSSEPNSFVPPMFPFPNSKTEFDEKHWSGNYFELSSSYRAGDLVIQINNKGPLLKPAVLHRIGNDGTAEIEISEYDQRTKTVEKVKQMVDMGDIMANQLAGPNIFVDNKTKIPKSIAESQYDQEINFRIAEKDLEPFCNALANRSNAQFRDKWAFFREHPAKPKVEIVDHSGDYITGELVATIVSVRNLNTKHGSGDIFVEIKTYEHNYEEEQFGKFARSDSFTRCRDSQIRNTKARKVTSFEPIAKTVFFDQDMELGSFVKNATHEIYFLVKQEKGGSDVEIGRASIKSDEFLDPFRPAKEVYLLLDTPPYFVSSIYLNMLFIPSDGTMQRMKLGGQIKPNFDQAYDQWIISQDGYVDRYGFLVPIGKYHPRLIDMKTLDFEDSDEEEYKRSSKANMRRQSKTPDKRVMQAVEGLPSLRNHNLRLKEKEKFRPEYEEIFYYFRQMQMYLNNEAKANANEIRQEYCWNDFLMKVTDNIHDMSEQGDDFGEQDNKGHMFSVANRSHWKNNSWQNEDIWSLWKLGISYNLRSRIWYDLLEVYALEEMTHECFKQEDEFNRDISIFSNLKHFTQKYYNIAFVQVDEDMSNFSVSNTPSRDDRGKIKTILKCFIVWQKICKIDLCYSINFGYIIQRLLCIFTEERTFWIFTALMHKIKDRIGITDSVMLDRKGMFRLISAWLSSHTKEIMPELFSKFTEIGLSVDFFLYDKISSLFANTFPTNTLFRLWDLIILELSSPVDGGVSKGLGYTVSTCLYLLSINEEQIKLATTPEELHWALENSWTAKYNTEEIIEAIFNKNTYNFVAGNWFTRRLASISKTFGDAASYLDNKRISLEEDYDLVFEKTMRENRAIWDLLNDEDGREMLEYPDWYSENSKSILSRFKDVFEQKPSMEYSSKAYGNAKTGNLELSTIYLFFYNMFDAQFKDGSVFGKFVCWKF